MDDHGLRRRRARRTGVGTVFVTPAHQYPTGVVLAPDAPPRAPGLGAGDGGLVIEDDYDAEHRYDRAPVAALRRVAPEHVVYLGSVSKTLAPALRLGWVVAPRGRARGAGGAQAVVGHHQPRARPARPRRADHVGRVRAAPAPGPQPASAARRDALLDALRGTCPQARVHGVAAGLHLLVGLPDGSTTPRVAERALAAGVAVQPLSYHRLRPGPPGLVIGYAATTPDRLREGVRLLADAL